MERAFNLQNNFRTLFVRPPHGHFDSLDGLRALSILWVIAFHLGAFLQYFNSGATLDLRSRPEFMWTRLGYYGVDVFFVVSGFIIGHILMTERRETGSLDLGRFYRRRALRLLPAYYLAMFLWAGATHLNVRTSWANLLYVNNFVPMKDQFMTWTWSLAIEEQFYILFPILLVLAARTSLRWTYFVVGLAFAIAIRVFIAEYYQIAFPLVWRDDAAYHRYFDLLYDKLYTRYGALLIGIGVAYYRMNGGLAHRIWSNSVWRWSVALVALAAFAPALFSPEVTDPLAIHRPYFYMLTVYYPYIFAMAVALILMLSLRADGKRSWWRVLLGARIWVPFAQLSYSAYLIHPLVILIAYRIIYGVHGSGVIPSRRVFTAGVIVTLAIFVTAALVYLLVERPMMNLRRSPATARTLRAAA